MRIPITDNNKDTKDTEERETKDNTTNNMKEKETFNEEDNNKEIQESKVEKSKDEIIEEYKEQLQRIQAEFINYRKRVEKERKKDFLNAKADLMLCLLPVLDDFDRMFEHYKEDKQCNINEVKMLYDNLKKSLYEQKLNELEDEGEEFDPNVHEAVGVIKTSMENDEKVMEVLQKGYTIDDKLLRPSRVKVGKYIEEKNKDEKDSDQ